MEWLRAIGDLIDSFAWPVVFVVVLLLFRDPLKRILSGIRLRSVKGGVVEAEFEQRVDEVRREAPQSLERELLTLDAESTHQQYSEEEIARRLQWRRRRQQIRYELQTMANIDPPGAMPEAWSRLVRVSLTHLASAAELPGTLMHSDDSLLAAMRNGEVIPGDTFLVALRLLELRRDAQMIPDHVSKSAALEFIDGVYTLSEALDLIAVRKGVGFPQYPDTESGSRNQIIGGSG